MKGRESIASLILCSLGIVIAAQSFRLRLGMLTEPGPGFFPFWSGVILGFLALLTFLKRSLGKPAQAPPWNLRERWGQLTLVVGVLLAYSVSLEPAGFILSTFLLLIVLFKVMGAGRLVFLVGGSGAISVVVYSVFKFWLGVQLPKGPIDF